MRAEMLQFTGLLSGFTGISMRCMGSRLLSIPHLRLCVMLVRQPDTINFVALLDGMSGLSFAMHGSSCEVRAY